MEYEFGALKNQFLSKYTTLGVGGMADYVLSVGSNRELRQALEWIGTQRIPYHVLGRGSKVLIDDKGVRGAVIILERMNEVVLTDNNEIVCGAGAGLAAVSMTAMKHSLAGLEWACGIPASIGGAIFMNAGAFGGDMSMITTNVQVFDGTKLFELTKDECEFSYRGSLFSRMRAKGKTLIITSATLSLAKGNKEDILSKRNDFTNRRLISQPKGRSAGSSFRRVDGISAGELIDKCGLKGYNIGGAAISDKHANFILNKGTASSRDVESLLELCERKVFNKFGIRLVREIIKV